MIEKIRPLTPCVSPGGRGHGVTWKGMNEMHSNRRMIEKIRPLTCCFSPGGREHGVTWNGMNKIYVIMHNNRIMIDHLPTVLVQEVEDMVLHGRVRRKYK